MQKGLGRMKEITVTVDHEGKNYLTNVIIDRDVPDEEVKKRALMQVLKQKDI